MGAYFLDSSALVKRYVRERGTGFVREIIDPDSGNEIYISRITGAEVVAAIARRGRIGDLEKEEVDRAVRQFRVEFERLYRVVEITPEVICRAMDLALRYGLRGYDAVQLASALEVRMVRAEMLMGELVLVSSDSELNEAAEEEGMRVEDPNLKDATCPEGAS